MALSANRDTVRYGELKGIDEIPVGASKTIYQGGLVSVLKSATVPAYAQAAGDTANTVCKGVALNYVANGATAGAVNVQTAYGEFEFSSAGLSASNEGDAVYIVDDETVNVKSVTAQDIGCGIITKVISATSCRVMVTPEAIHSANHV